MSWHSIFPQQRRSRSRSPRGPYNSRPDPAFPQDSYRDYDAYDRGYGFERDRPPYDYGRRPRSRSPPYEDSRKRRRSTSPYDSRYEPRPRYNDDFDRGYGHSPPRRSYNPARRAPPPDPHTFEYPASLKEYAEWFRYYFPQQATDEDNADKTAEIEAGDGSKPRNGIKSRWEKYKKDFAATQLQTMYDHHRRSPWFAEKYDPAPEFEKLRDRVRKEGWKGRLITFLHDLESGKFDPDLIEPELEPPSPVKETANNDEPHPEDRKAMDDDMQFNIDVEDDTGDQDVPRGEANGKHYNGKRNDKDEETSVLPEGNQVMIRTIPPDIGRLKLEEVCKAIPGFMYLALGDPLQKRNFYRAGWIRFQEDADMSAVMAELSDKKIDGFKLHVSHSTRPFVNKIRFTPELASLPSRLANDLANAKALATLLEDQASRLRKLKFSSETNDGSIDVNMSGQDEDEEPGERGSDAVERRAEKIMADLRDQNLVDVNDETAYETKKAAVTLDLFVAYLRAAFHTCFYCCVVTDHLEELQRKCLKHVRRPLSKAHTAETEKGANEANSTEDVEKERDSRRDHRDHRDPKRNDDRWLEWFDTKMALLINRDGVDPREYSGKSYEEELGKVVQPHIKQEDEGKFRCKTCNKLFKATSFVEKHILNKHPELILGLDELSYFNNFALDPHRIQPFTRPPPVIGNNSSHAPPQAFGIQPSASNDSRFGHHSNGYYRDEATMARRLSDRIAGFAPTSETSTLLAAAGLPPKPVSALDTPLSTGHTRRGRGGTQTGGLPPPPPNVKEDPRAVAGKRVSYHDMDLVAEGDVELFY